jgi:hypothetical protein
MDKTLNAQAARAAERLLELTEDHPVHRRQDLLALGITDSTQTAMIRRGLLTRLRHGIYADARFVANAEPPERHRIDAAAAIAASREPCWAFGATAALLHRQPLPFLVPSSVGLIRGAGQDLRGLRRESRHRIDIPDTHTRATSLLSDNDVTTIRGVPCLNRIDAALTAARVVGQWRKVVLIDSLLFEGVPLELILNAETKWRSLGQHAEVLVAAGLARRGAQTPLETISRLALAREGLPEPELQVPFDDAAGLIGIVDLWWPSLGVIGEADGALKYASKADLLREKAREDRLRALGIMVVRWTWEEITRTPEVVAERIRRAALIANWRRAGLAG